jgi:hypothetical protein
MDLDVGSPAWYVLMLLLGLAVGLAIAWVRRIRRSND